VKLTQYVGGGVVVAVVSGVVVIVVMTPLQHCNELHRPMHTVDVFLAFVPGGQEKRVEAQVGSGVVVSVVMTTLQH